MKKSFFKLFTLFSLVLLLAACATHGFNKRKYTKGRFLVKKERFRSPKSHTEETANSTLITDKEKQIQTNFTITDQAIDKAIAADLISEKPNEPKPFNEQTDEIEYTVADNIKTPEFDDTVYISSNSIEGQTANKTERKGATALILSIVGAALYLLGPLLLVGLILHIIAVVMAHNSLRVKYNTRKGQRMAKISLVLSWICIALFIAVLILIFLILLSLGF